MFGFLKRRGTDPEASIKKVLGDLELPSFPGVVLKTLDAIRDPEASVASVSAVLPSLAKAFLACLTGRSSGSQI